MVSRYVRANCHFMGRDSEVGRSPTEWEDQRGSIKKDNSRQQDSDHVSTTWAWESFCACGEYRASDVLIPSPVHELRLFLLKVQTNHFKGIAFCLEYVSFNSVRSLVNKRGFASAGGQLFPNPIQVATSRRGFSFDHATDLELKRSSRWAGTAFRDSFAR